VIHPENIAVFDQFFVFHRQECPSEQEAEHHQRGECLCSVQGEAGRDGGQEAEGMLERRDALSEAYIPPQAHGSPTLPYRTRQSKLLEQKQQKKVSGVNITMRRIAK